MNGKHKPVFIVKKMWDEGTASPFPARLMLQMFNFRDTLLLDRKERDDFDSAYKPILENYKELSLVIKKLKNLKQNHIKDVENGLVVKIQPNHQINIENTIDEEYRSGIKDVFIKGEMTISGLAKLGEIFGVQIDYFFASDKKFKRGSEELFKRGDKYAKFILKKIHLARSKWYAEFNNYRNYIEHHYVKIPDIKYLNVADGKFEAEFPKIENGFDLLETLERIKENILELVEDVLIFFFSTKLKPGLTIKEIPLNERNPDIVKKYAIYVRLEDQDIRYGNP